MIWFCTEHQGICQNAFVRLLSCCSSWNHDAYEFALENQAGQGMRFDDPQDRKALVMGLALHEQGKQSLEKVQICICVCHP